METLQPELRTVIGPRLKGKMQQRQRNWMLVSSADGGPGARCVRTTPAPKPTSVLQISDAVYRQVLSQTSSQYEALVEACEAEKAPLDARLRTDMDQLITSKEHVSSKIKGGTEPDVRNELNKPFIDRILRDLLMTSLLSRTRRRSRSDIQLQRGSSSTTRRARFMTHVSVSILYFHPL